MIVSREINERPDNSDKKVEAYRRVNNVNWYGFTAGKITTQEYTDIAEKSDIRECAEGWVLVFTIKIVENIDSKNRKQDKYTY